MIGHPERSFARLERDLRALRHAVEALRLAGVSILSAEVTTLSDSPTIHVVDHPTIRALPNRYTRARLAGVDIHAAPYLECQVTWLDTAPAPGRMAEFPDLERTADHG